MKRRTVFLFALLGTLLLAVPAQAHAFFGFFGGGFSFGAGTGWGGWGGPGWWGPGWWGVPRYGWYRPHRWYRPWHWRRYFYRPYLWPRFGYGAPLPYLRMPSLSAPVVTTPAEKEAK